MKSAVSLVLILLLVVGSVKSQNVAWDSLTVPDVYPSRVELHRASPPGRKDIVMLGNSITFWGEWSFLLKSKRVKNQGIPGDTSFGILRRIDDAVKGEPRKIFILAGINDLGRSIPDTIILRNYERMVRRIKAISPRTQVYLQTILPTNESAGRVKHLYHKEANIAFINAEMKSMAAREGAVWVNLHTQMADEAGKLKKEYTWDGVHLTLAGYRAWADVLKKGGYLR